MKPTAEDFQRTKPEDVLKELSVDPARGLTEEEAKHRLEIYGFNEDS
jgi:magnesium-transporting ATPase (P-type)